MQESDCMDFLNHMGVLITGDDKQADCFIAGKISAKTEQMKKQEFAEKTQEEKSKNQYMKTNSLKSEETKVTETKKQEEKIVIPKIQKKTETKKK